jgi:all-trans-8'-apo-beta-carotenal 15,15'-oxygenase
VPLPGLGLVHDMALTQRYAVFVVSPLRINPWALTGYASYWDSMHFDATLPTYFVLAPRDGGPVRTVATDTFFHLHFTNAYDDGDDVVVELPRFSPQAYEGVKNYTAHIRSDSAQIAVDVADPIVLNRFRITQSGRVHSQPLTDLGCEFPQIDQRRSTLRQRFSYVVVQDPDRFSGQGIARIDHTGGAEQTFCPVGNMLVEPVFVPRPGSTAEDDGWVLTVGYQPSRHRSRLMIFDAAQLADGPIAEAWLPFHVPMSYHGTFTSRVARVDQAMR